ncbi:MAG: CidA/LrgA family protein [Bacteroidetes bacterium]|nr:CidA/LrgA family protein [Bacteroidota bacterium]
MLGVFIILLMLMLGNGISFLMNGVIPGSVIGMVLLFLALITKIVKPETIKQPASYLIKHMSLFFIPAGVGLMTAWNLIADHWAAILVSTILSTIIVLAVVGLVQQKLEKD